MVERTPEVFREEHNIDVRTHHEVEEIDLNRRRVLARQPETGGTSWEPFDHLHLAMGSSPIRPGVPGGDAPGIYGLSTLQSGIRVREAIDREKPKHAVIVGGGYIGLEMAEALFLRDIRVSLVEKLPQVMNTFDPDMSVLVSEELRRIGVNLLLEESLEGFDISQGKVSAVITNRQTIPTKMVILGMGVRPNSEMAAGAGIPLGEKNSIKVNERMQTGAPNVWAAGDCVESFNLVSRKPFYIALGTVANKQGRVAGINLGGGYATFPGVVGTAVSKICDMEVSRTGLLEREIKQLGLEYVSAIINSRTHSRYYPNSGPITVKLLAERGSGRLLGGQIVGAETAAKRIDVIAVALHAGFTVDEMINLDLGYAPPLSLVWDPVLIAARNIVKLL